MGQPATIRPERRGSSTLNLPLVQFGVLGQNTTSMSQGSIGYFPREICEHVEVFGLLHPNPQKDS